MVFTVILTYLLFTRRKAVRVFSSYFNRSKFNAAPTWRIHMSEKTGKDLQRYITVGLQTSNYCHHHMIWLSSFSTRHILENTFLFVLVSTLYDPFWIYHCIHCSWGGSWTVDWLTSPNRFFRPVMINCFSSTALSLVDSSSSTLDTHKNLMKDLESL